MSNQTTKPMELHRKGHKRNRESYTKPATLKPSSAKNGANICPRCQNTDHPEGAKFCKICGLALTVN